MAITQFTQGKWDTADVIVTIDSYQPLLYSSGDIFTLTYTDDNVTVTTDIKGNGITVIHHSGKATLTVNISALDEEWKKVLKDYNPQDTHVVDIMTPVEHIHTDSAFLPKLPDINSGSEAPTRALAFTCIKALAEPAA